MTIDARNRGSATPRPWGSLGLRTGLVAVALVAGLLLLPSILPASPIARSGIASSETIPPWNTWTCNPPNLSPAALEIPLASPANSEPAGAVLKVAYEYMVAGFQNSSRGTTVHLPLVQATFPIRPKGDLTLTIAHANVTVSKKGWSSPTLLVATKTLTAATNFTSANAQLSTSKYAVMANAVSGVLTLEFRWRWSVAPAFGSPFVNGTWSVPSKKAMAPSLPSIFYPAPYVGVVSTSGSPAKTGSNFTMELDGAVSNTSFRVVLEFPKNGSEIHSIWENTSSKASVFNATVPLTRADGRRLVPATFLIHVHDVCGAIVQMFSIQVTHGVMLTLGPLAAESRRPF
jgi:hypothetical protein